MSDQDLDRIAREKIRKDISSNFFVEAGAGSGKTTVLVDCMVSMVEGGLDISRICAITFTKAAASEFYARFQKKLSESESENAKNALKDIDLCFMGTIDSFCNMVLSEHPAKAGIPSNAEVVTEDEMKTLYRRELSRIRQGLYEEDYPGLQSKYNAFSDLYWNSEEIFMKGLTRLMSTRNTRFNHPAVPAKRFSELYADDIEKLKDILSILADHPEAMPEKPQTAAKATKALTEGIRYIRSDWDENFDDVLRTLKDLKGLRIIPEFDVDKLGPYRDRLFVIRESRGKFAGYEVLPEEFDPLLISKLENYRYAFAMDFIASCVEPVAQKLKAEGRLSYSDYLLYLRDMLRADAASGGLLIRHICRRHSYFLIDEFQDTDPVQAEIFFYLTAENPAEDWKKCVPRPGSLFIVGDPKQSIYRFRNADVASFQKVKAMFADGAGEVLQLSRNYRSSDKLCSWFNETFHALLPEDTADQSRFEPIPLGGKPEYKASLNGTFRYETSYARSIKDSKDFETVAEIIRQIVDDPSVTIQGRGEDAQPRHPSYGDFMIITPGKTHMTYYMQALSTWGIPFRVEGKLLFDSCPALKMVCSLMSAAADPYDRKRRFVLDSLSGCSVAEGVLLDYQKISKSMSPAAFFSLLVDREKVFAKAGVENAEYLYFAQELLRQAEIDGMVSTAADGAEFLSGLINGGSDQERCIQLLRDADRVHLANLHKVKGLEAPIVILADPKQSSRDPDNRADYLADPPQSWIFKVSSAVSNQYAAEMEQETNALNAERDRLLYVAATRAENALIVSFSRKKDGDLSASPWNPFDRHIQDDIFDTIRHAAGPYRMEREVVDAAELYAAAETESPLNDTDSFECSYEIVRPSTIKTKGISEEGEPEDRSADAESKPSGKPISRVEDPALAGTMIHRLMEVLVSSHNNAEEEALVNETLKEYGADPAQYGPVLHKVVQTVRNGGFVQNTNAPQDILTELLSAEEVHCELPFCWAESPERIWHGIMDAVYRKDGKWHIIDYKTNADPEDLNERYQAQLSAYTAAFRAMTGEEADALVWHIVI